MQNKVRDKKLIFIEPQNKFEQDEWLDRIINDIEHLKKKEYADLLS
jgi:hypothetical protein